MGARHPHGLDLRGAGMGGVQVKIPVGMIFSMLKNLNASWEQEYKFHAARRWRFDYALPPWKIAIEIQGSIWSRARSGHQGKGHYRDMEKMNAAQELGWRVFQFAPEQADEMFALLRRIV